MNFADSSRYTRPRKADPDSRQEGARARDVRQDRCRDVRGEFYLSGYLSSCQDPDVPDHLAGHSSNRHARVATGRATHSGAQLRTRIRRTYRRRPGTSGQPREPRLDEHLEAMGFGQGRSSTQGLDQVDVNDETKTARGQSRKVAVQWTLL